MILFSNLLDNFKRHTPNVPTSTKIIVLPAIKQQAKQPTTTQTSNDISPDFMVSLNNDMIS